jgi:hypothetical protein
MFEPTELLEDVHYLKTKWTNILSELAGKDVVDEFEYDFDQLERKCTTRKPIKTFKPIWEDLCGLF